LRRAAGAREEDCLVFLGGPFIEPTERAKSIYSKSAELRYELFHRLQAQEFMVSLGEYKELIESYREALGDKHNAVAAEVNHAKSGADAIVLIVDSPGSFAEIGAFSLIPQICEKMMIISSVAHEKSDGYVATGPIVLARAFRARIEYLDLSDFDRVEQVVLEFLKDIIQYRTLRALISS
jgi:hypothetical protein